MIGVNVYWCLTLYVQYTYYPPEFVLNL